MPATITLGHILLLMAATDLAVALLMLARASRHAGHGRGTPQYARARTGRRAALYALALALGLGLLALTPLGGIVLIGEGA